MTTIAKISSLLIFLLFLTSALHAQRRKEYSGPITLSDGKIAEAKFEYIERKDERLLDGNYSLTIKETDSLGMLNFQKIAWNGKYTESKKTNDWLYQEFKHRINIKDVIDFVPQTTIESTVNELHAVYQNGQPDGQWRFTEKVFLPDEKPVIITKGMLQFADGGVNGKIELEAIIKNSLVSISGHVNSSSHMDSVWVFRYLQDSIPVVERRLYNDGLLTEVEISDANTEMLLEEFEWKDVKSGLHGSNKLITGKSTEVFDLTFDNGYAPYGPELTVQYSGNEILSTIVRKMLSLDTAFHLDRQMPFGTSRFIYKRTEQDLAYLKEIDALADSIDFIIREYRLNRTLDINRQLTDSLAWASTYIRQYPPQLNRIKSTIQFIKSERFTFVDPSIFFSQNAIYFRPEQVIIYDYHGERKKKEIPYTVSSVQSLQDFKLRLQNEWQTLSAISRTINRELDRILKSNKLQVIENMILSERMNLDSLYRYDSLKLLPQAKEVTDVLYARFAENKYNELLQTYSSSQSFKEKDSLAYSIVSFLDVLADVPAVVNEIYKRHKQIDDMYTEVKMDPYTFNYNFKTRKKRKIYEKAGEELFAFRIEELKKEDDYKELNHHLESIQQLQKRLIELLHENTTQIERNLKKNDSPAEVAKIINI